jgi:hypothetical protein
MTYSLELSCCPSLKKLLNKSSCLFTGTVDDKRGDLERIGFSFDDFVV